jgi:hypothetical protein
VRKLSAVAALSVFGALLVAANPVGPPIAVVKWTTATWLLVGLLLVTMTGLLREWYWSRWSALAAAIAVLPWTVAFIGTPGYGIPKVRPALAGIASVVLLMTLVGRRMFDRFEGRSQTAVWRRSGTTLIRWTVICNLASVLGLFAFVAFYDFRSEWHLPVLASLMVGLLLGVALLARQKTLGVLAVAVSCVCFLPAGGHFVWSEATSAGEAVLFAAVFLPGVLTGWATLLTFGAPMVRYLRAG